MTDYLTLRETAEFMFVYTCFLDTREVLFEWLKLALIA